MDTNINQQDLFDAKDAYRLAHQNRNENTKAIWLKIVQPLIKKVAKQGKFYCSVKYSEIVNLEDSEKPNVNPDNLIAFGKSLGYKITSNRGVFEIQFDHFTMSK